MPAQVDREITFVWEFLSRIGSVLAFMSTLAVGLFALITNPHVRERAANHPDSTLSKLLKTLDRIIDAIFAWQAPLAIPLPVQESAENQVSRVPSSDDARAFRARRAFFVSFELKQNVPERVWLLWLPHTQLFIFVSLLGLTFFLAWLSGAGSFVVMGIAYMVSFIASVIAFFALMLGGDRTLLDSMYRLMNNPAIDIIITQEGTWALSAWGRPAIRTAGLRFLPIEGSVMSGIGYKTPEKTEPTVIFAYPTYFNRFLMDDDELRLMCKRLNELVTAALQFSAYRWTDQDTAGGPELPEPSTKIS